eukprot:TRINITY_DN4277_c0_g1_i1.p1 TRINITY_DN4277_c0_g1~~TRINITY_DN4277_c0_g1_i1.p1  ORF type:complete len:541 (+),score=96.04 TRINITY_DN4277_c0_g1_i1:179-1801(+)
MVTASKVLQASGAASVGSYTGHGHDERAGLSQSQEPSAAYDYDEGYEDAYPELPLSYGERLVLDTYLRGRSKPYDRQRQEELAKPKRENGFLKVSLCSRATTASIDGGTTIGTTIGGSSSSTAKATIGSKADVQSIVARLTEQKPRPDPTGPRNKGEAIVFETMQQQREKFKGLKTADIVHRLATPRALRPLSPNPGERIMMLHATPRRPYSKDRLEFLSKSSRRAGSSGAWGVHCGPGSSYPHDVLHPPAPPPLPKSAREAPAKETSARESSAREAKAKAKSSARDRSSRESGPRAPGARDATPRRQGREAAESSAETDVHAATAASSAACDNNTAARVEAEGCERGGTAGSGLETDVGSTTFGSSAAVSRLSTPARTQQGALGSAGHNGATPKGGLPELPGLPDSPGPLEDEQSSPPDALDDEQPKGEDDNALYQGGRLPEELPGLSALPAPPQNAPPAPRCEDDADLSGGLPELPGLPDLPDPLQKTQPDLLCEDDADSSEGDLPELPGLSDDPHSPPAGGARPERPFIDDFRQRGR